MIPCTVSGNGSGGPAAIRPPLTSPRSISIRTYSSAQSGLPPTSASSSACTSAWSTARSSSAPSSRAVCSSLSGESEIVVAFRLPPPQPGRRASSSGRAVAITSSGTSALRSTSSSTKSSSAVVGPVQVLEDEHERPVLGHRLEEAPPGGELPLAPLLRGALGADPDEPAQVRLDPARLGLVRDERLHGDRELRLRIVGRVGREHAGLRLHHLRRRPERHALAVGQRAAAAPEHEVGLGVERGRELRDEPALADARDADERDELRRAVAPRSVERVPQHVDLVRTPDERRTPPARRSAPISARGATASQAGTGSALPFATTGSAVRYSIASRVARQVASPTSTPSGGAAASRRFAVFTTSPDAVASPSSGRAPSATSASPVFTPTRTRSSNAGPASFRSATASRIASAARTARSGSSSRETGAPNRPITASPMNFSAVPPKRSSSARSRAAYGRLHGAHVLGIEPLRLAREADEIGEQDGDDLALFSRARARPTVVPQAGQKRAPGGSSAWQAAQTATARG